MNVFDRIEAGFDRRVAAGRRRSRRFDHFWRAQDHYYNLLGPRLAAAIAYYGFFAVFALGLVAYSIFGFVVRSSHAVQIAVDQFLIRNLPFVGLDQIRESSSTIGVIGLVILLFTGVGWVEAIRSSQRLIYGLEQQPGNVVIRWLVDLAVLFGVFVLLGVSIAAIDALESLLSWLLRSTGSVGLAVVSGVLSVLVNAVLAAMLMIAVPRLKISRRRLRPSIMFLAIGITLLNTVGRYYVVRTERNPAYTVVAGAVGLLLYLYLLNQLLLFGAAVAATSGFGRVVDLAGGEAATTDAPVDPRPHPTARPRPMSRKSESGQFGQNVLMAGAGWT
ncbi:YihY/virulence factor BrkB family protein [Micromonospora zhanjiangensis]